MAFFFSSKQLPAWVWLQVQTHVYMREQLRNTIGSVYRTVTKQGQQRYLSIKWRLLLGLPIAVLMVLVGKRWEWIVTLATDHIGLLAFSVLGSYVIVLPVLGFAHWANRWLDTQCDWRTNERDRMIAQVALPLTGSWVISILLAITLFAWLGIDIEASGYFRFEVWIVLLLLLSMNAGYAFWSRHRQLDDLKEEVAYLEVVTPENHKIRVSELEIAFIQAANGFRLVRMLNGDVCYTNKSIIELEGILNPQRFYKLKRKYLINTAIVQKLAKVKKPKVDKRTGVETLKYSWALEFGNEATGRFKENLVKGRVKEFEAWWRAGKHIKPD